MAQLTNVHDPQWLLLPVNNDRTAWRPFGLPMLLVVPHRRDPLGTPLANSNIDCIKVYIENVPQWAEVVGHQHIIQVQPADYCERPLVTLTQYTNHIATNTQTNSSYETTIQWLADNNFTLAPDGTRWIEQSHIYYTMSAPDQGLVTLTQYAGNMVTHSQAGEPHAIVLKWLQDNGFIQLPDNHWIQAHTPYIYYTISQSNPYYTQLRHPTNELYAVLVNAFQLAARQIPVLACDYYRLLPLGQPVGADCIRTPLPPYLTLHPIEGTTAGVGDYIRYTTSSGITDVLPYLPDADYYDLSDILLEVEQLPSDRYVLVYQCEYYTRERTTVGTGELLCINPNSQSLALFRFPFNHPGELMDEFVRLTPEPYLTHNQKSQDSTIAFYRPFTDALQDVYDEQILLGKVNWVYNIPDPLIPYLSTLLGWDFPYLPNEFGNLRRVLLRSTSWLQTIKGSRLAVIEIFRLLGLEILVNNLWWSPDGQTLITPGERQDYRYLQQQIRLRARDQIEPLLADYQVSGLGGLQIPLIYRPQLLGGLDSFQAAQDSGDVYVSTFLVDTDASQYQLQPGEVFAYDLLVQWLTGDSEHTGALSDPTAFSQERQTVPVQYIKGQTHTFQDNFLTRALLSYSLDSDSNVTVTPRMGQGRTVVKGLGSFSQVRLAQNAQPGVASGPLGIVLSELTYTDWTAPAVLGTGLQFDRTNNTIQLTFNGYIDFSGTADLPGARRSKACFSFACYTRQELVVPESMRNLQSNRFDIQLLQVDSVPPLAGIYTQINPQLLDFAIEFLSKVKAFHSLLHIIQFTLELTETYLAADICIGGDIQQRYDIDMGRLQVPYAIIPHLPGEACDQLDPLALGYKHADIIYRLRKLANLPEEHAAWQRLDQLYQNSLGAYSNRTDSYDVDIIRITPNRPTDGLTECQYTRLGQDRIVSKPRRTMEVGDLQYQLEGLAVVPEYGPAPNAAQNTVNADVGIDATPSRAIRDGQFNTHGIAVSTNNNSAIYGSFIRQYDDLAGQEPLCTLDDVTDYCYRGRVADEILYRQALVHREIYHNRMVGLTLGTGVYWVYSALAQEWIAGTGHPVMGSRTGKYCLTGNAHQAFVSNYKNTNTRDGSRQSPYLNAPYDQLLPPAQDTFLGRLLQAYGNPAEQSLHFANTIQPPAFRQTSALSLLRPSLDIQLSSLHFPGCRFPQLFGLPTDFIHDTWQARPWDDAYSTACGPRGWGIAPEPTWLHATLVPDVYGDQTLVFDPVAYRIPGNGIIPDIPALDDHGGTAVEHQRVVHSVYSSAPVGYLDPDTGMPAITMEQMYTVTTTVVGISNPLFDTHTECSDLYLHYTMTDYIDGYPAETGLQFIGDLPDTWVTPAVPPGSHWTMGTKGRMQWGGGSYGTWQLYAQHRRPNNDSAQLLTFEALPEIALFFLGDGILESTGYRLDTNDGKLNCNGTVGVHNSNMTLYRDDTNCGIDPNEDRVQLLPVLNFIESYGGAAPLLNGSIRSLFELLPACPTGAPILPRLEGDGLRCFDQVTLTS